MVKQIVGSELFLGPAPMFPRLSVGDPASLLDMPREEVIGILKDQTSEDYYYDAEEVLEDVGYTPRRPSRTGDWESPDTLVRRFEEEQEEFEPEEAQDGPDPRLLAYVAHRRAQDRAALDAMQDAKTLKEAMMVVEQHRETILRLARRQQ